MLILLLSSNNSLFDLITIFKAFLCSGKMTCLSYSFISIRPRLLGERTYCEVPPFVSFLWVPVFTFRSYF